MITMDMLRERIHAAGAWEDISDVLGLDMVLEELDSLADDEIVYKAFVQGSIKSKKLRKKLHHHPFPDIADLGRYSEPDMEYHLGGGLNVAISITQKAKQYDRPFTSAKKVFDFGCGTSRILRYIVEFLPGPQYYGSEVFKKNVEWGKSAFPEVIYLHQKNFPPIEIPNETFDVIYAYSIFTHFEEKLHNLWITELHRMLKKGGLLLITVHGEKILQRCKNESAVRASMCVEGRDYQELCETFYNYGYVFYKCYDRQHLSQGGLDSNVFGITYISKNYIMKNWTNRFQILEHDEGAITNWQDWVVMEKR
jgi:SAM-dependent methyltransferase